jgi:peroxiredoxin
VVLKFTSEFVYRTVDEIVVFSVNDAYVMSAWAKNLGAEGKVRSLLAHI